MIRVRDVEASLKFYTELLEMKVVREKELSDCRLYFLSDKSGHAELELTYNFKTPDEGYEIGSGFGHFGFKIESMAEFDKKLKEFGGEYLYEPYKLSPTGSTIAFIKDPDGYEIELIEKNKK